VTRRSSKDRCYSYQIATHVPRKQGTSLEGLTIIVRTIERVWHVALTLVIVSGSVIAAHRLGLPELAMFRPWIEWAPVGVAVGTSIALVGTGTWLARQLHSAVTARRGRKENAKAFKEHAEAVHCELDLVRRNLTILNVDERTLLMDVLKRHPYHVEVLEFGPSQSLISQDILCIVGEGSGATLICKLHPWLAAHRNELLSIIETGC
jgi:hypothetical protein